MTDAATFNRLLWQHQPELLIEIGTMCGGSATFFAMTMAGYNPNARVITWDVGDAAWRAKACTGFHRGRSVGPPALHSDLWAAALRIGRGD